MGESWEANRVMMLAAREVAERCSMRSIQFHRVDEAGAAGMKVSVWLFFVRPLVQRETGIISHLEMTEGLGFQRVAR